MALATAKKDRQVGEERARHFADKADNQLRHLHLSKGVAGNRRVLQRGREAEEDPRRRNHRNRHHQRFAKRMDLAGELFHGVRPFRSEGASIDPMRQ
ncbi:hypothetical protein OJE16_10215 [Pantoea tagorei]